MARRWRRRSGGLAALAAMAAAALALPSTGLALAPIEPGDILVTNQGFGAGGIVGVDPGTGAQDRLTDDPARGVVQLDDGDLVVLDAGGVARIDPRTGTRTPLSPPFNWGGASGVARESDDDLVFGSLTSVVRRDAQTGAWTTVSAGGLLESTRGIAVEDDGSIVVVDTAREPGRVIRIDPDTGDQVEVPSGGFVDDPLAVAAGPGGRIYVTTTTGRVVRIDPVQGAAVLTSDGLISGPFGIATEPGGDVVVTSSYDNRLVRVDPLSGAQSEVASGGLLAGPHAVAVARVATDPNIAPTADGWQWVNPEDTTLEVEAPGVLERAADADGDTLTAVLDTAPAHGQLDLRPDGSFTYIPDPNFADRDVFAFRASDGKAVSAPATIEIAMNPLPDPPTVSVVGGTCADPDTAASLTLRVDDPDSWNPPGSLTVTATSGNATVLPASGVSLGGAGVTRTLSLAGSGRAGSAFVGVTVSDGALSGSVPIGVFMGKNGPDTLAGTLWDDVILGRGGNDTLSGDGGNDLLCGAKGTDTLSGGAGDDSLYGGIGADLFSGGPGVDLAPDLSAAQGDTQDGTIP